MKVILCVLLISLAGCSTGYSRPGASYNDYLNERLECVKISAARNCLNMPLYRSCMMQKGWQEVQDGGFMPPSGMGLHACE